MPATPNHNILVHAYGKQKDEQRPYKSNQKAEKA